MKYVVIPTNTIEGLKRANRYYARGWRIFYTGLFTVTLSKSSS
jgi:hypothetical protein